MQDITVIFIVTFFKFYKHISSIFQVYYSSFCKFFGRAEIRAALNAQTESQFQSYASLHHPDDPVKRAELIAQLQERHFHEYVAYLQRRYLLIEQSHLESNSPTTNTISSNVPIASDSAPEAVNNVNGDQATNTSTGIPATEVSIFKLS
ncbi:unnamed protein product [Trichobilharzia regenti]|nr:unnamed protein product [Trichobilharzia regenti]